MTIRVMLVGLGPIGCGIAAQLAARAGFEIVAAVDIDAAKAGRDLGDVAELGRTLGVAIARDPVEAARASAPHVAVSCTGSSLEQVTPELEGLLGLRLPVVSTTEELSYPWHAHAELARRIDAAAKAAGVAIVGTGVNPGFAMDALPIALTAICERVDAVRVERLQDARIRRVPFQRKIGAGLTPAEFAERVAAGTVRHVGLAESVAMIADALGWTLDRITDEIRPKIADAPVASEAVSVAAGQVSGIVQDGVGFVAGRPAIELHMEAYLGSPETRDTVHITGTPNLHVEADGGYHGDVATHSITVNTIPKVLAATPGLHTMRTLALPSFAGAP
jgi:4-hydroxy-tetrahydrodipicolinate reductase